jgi:hypothetical protein
MWVFCTAKPRIDGYDDPKTLDLVPNDQQIIYDTNSTGHESDGFL